MERSNHYEAAFEAYLQWHRLCYLAVDETHRAKWGDVPIKSLDFVVYGEQGARLLIDVKGRRFPTGPAGKERAVWECWSTRDDIDGLKRWADIFGPGYEGLLVFAYHLNTDVILPDDTVDLWSWRDRRYLLRAIGVADYRQHMRLRSPRWQTVSLPSAVFRKLARPLHDFTHGFPFVIREMLVPA